MQVVIHAGAVFTDEGLLLGALQANADVLTQNGVRVVGPRRYRQAFKSILASAETAVQVPTAIAEWKASVVEDASINRLILSSEDFIGERTSAIKDGQFFPSAGHRVAFMDRLFDNIQVELFVGLRDPGSFIPKVLMSLSEEERRNILAQTDLSCLSWLSMIEDIRDLAPDVRVTLWSNEDTPLIWGDILRAVCGLESGAALTDEFSLLSSLVSDTGKREILALVRQDASLDVETRQESLAKIFKEHAMPEAIEEELELPGWSEDIVSAFSELYQQDLARLQSMPDIRFLRPRTSG